MLTSSTVTQVFHIPVEERKDQVTGDFGSGSMDSSHKNIKHGTYLLHNFTYKDRTNVRVEKISKDSLDSIPSPSLRIQIIGGKVYSR